MEVLCIMSASEWDKAALTHPGNDRDKMYGVISVNWQYLRARPKKIDFVINGPTNCKREAPVTFKSCPAYFRQEEPPAVSDLRTAPSNIERFT